MCNANPKSKKKKEKKKKKKKTSRKRMATKDFEMKHKDHVRKTQLD